MSQRAEILEWAKNAGIFRAREAEARGVTRATLSRLVETGELERLERGFYRLAGEAVTENHTLALVAKRIDGAVVCLISALAFHGLTTQLPSAVWVAISPNRRAFENNAYPPVEITFMSPAVLEYGVDEHRIEKVLVRITNPARTVADCFKHRNKVGIDVALEALRDFRRLGKGSIDELWQAAKVCRVTRTLRPYLQAIHG